MAKSIHERVRAALEKQERARKRVTDSAIDSAYRRATRADVEFERGAEWYTEGNWDAPRGASAEFRAGMKAARDSETRELLGEY